VEAGGIVHMTGGTLTSTVGHTILDGGTLSMENSASFVGGGTLSNTGVVHGTGQISSALQNSFSGLVSVQSTDHLKFTAASNSNDGVIQLSGGTVEFTGALSNQATGRVIFARGTMQTSTLQNTGSIIISGGNADLLGALNNNATALVQVGNRSIGTFHDTVVNQPGSVFNIFFASSAVFTGDVSGLSAFIGGGAKTFQGIAAGGSLISTGSSVVESTGSLTVYSIRESALTVRGAAKVLPNGTASAFSRLSVLTIDGGALDLCDNHLILDSTDIASVKSYINSAYNAGSWNGNGLGSSSAQAQRTSLHHTALGYATASSLGVGTFDGQPVNGLSVLVRYAYSGDANLDGVVNALDFNALASSFGGASNRFWYQGDFNYDGMTNTLDFNALAINFNAALPGSPLGSLVPEPATSSACAIALIGTRRWRRRCAR
jgi:hypothetical protein